MCLAQGPQGSDAGEVHIGADRENFFGQNCNHFLIYQFKHYVLCAQKNHLIEMILLGAHK